MNQAKNEIVASITRAKLELDDALDELKNLPMLDPIVLGFIAHALNNYLHLISGTAELLGDALKDHADDKVAIWLKSLRDITPRMAHLVQEMRGSPGKTPPEMRFEKVDFAILAGRATGFYRRRAARKEVELLFEAANPPPPKVRADRIALAAIFDNLLSNAVKFSPPGKKVHVSVRRDGDSVICRVQDDGPGIRPEDRKRLFLRGAHLEKKPTDGGPSTGYSLAVAAELVAHLGGEIACDSDPGTGATFTIRLPCPRRAATPKRRPIRSKT